jgi:hypothetical protein
MSRSLQTASVTTEAPKAFSGLQAYTDNAVANGIDATNAHLSHTTISPLNADKYE